MPACVASYYHAAAPNHIAMNSIARGHHVRLVHPRTGQTLIATVAGTGPFVRGRCIDVSEQIASRFDMRRSGTALLRYERLD